MTGASRRPSPTRPPASAGGPVAQPGPTRNSTSDALSGDFDWRRFVFAFEVPSEACDGQWLRLDNPAPGGSAGIVTGDLWIDDLVVTRVDRPAESITAPSAPD